MSPKKMPYPGTEIRWNRERFTKQLAGICQLLDACSTKTVSSSAWRYGPSRDAEITVVRLWVVGSYARGAITCGDLDLVAEVTSPQGLPYSHVISNALLGKYPRMRMYQGSPLNNSSGAKFDEALLIWEGGADWRAALDAIKVNPVAGRQARETDRLPFRLEQLGLEQDFAQELLKQFDADMLRWSFVPLDKVPPVLAEGASCIEGELLRRMNFAGKDKQWLAPYVLGFLRSQPEVVGSTWSKAQSGMRIGGTLVMMGSPWQSELVLPRLDTSRVVVVPHPCTRGPNGFWLIERGLNHPMVQQFAGASVWSLSYPNMKPNAVDVYSSSNSLTTVVDAFACQEAAQASANCFNEDSCDNPAELLSPVKLEGIALLNYLSLGDGLMGFDGKDWPFNARAAQGLAESFHDPQPVPTLPELAELLRTTK